MVRGGGEGGVVLLESKIGSEVCAHPITSFGSSPQPEPTLEPYPISVSISNSCPLYSFPVGGRRGWGQSMDLTTLVGTRRIGIASDSL